MMESVLPKCATKTPENKYVLMLSCLNQSQWLLSRNETSHSSTVYIVHELVCYILRQLQSILFTFLCCYSSQCDLTYETDQPCQYKIKIAENSDWYYVNNRARQRVSRHMKTQRLYEFHNAILYDTLPMLLMLTLYKYVFI